MRSTTRKKVAIFGGSFNPAGLHHRRIAEVLARKFDMVKIIPCGPRPDKKTTNDIEPIHRAVMADLTFQDIADNVSVELFDLENGTFTPNYKLQNIFNTDGEIWHVVGTDLIRDGKKGKSLIQQEWFRGKELWNRANFAVILRRNTKFNPADLPPRHELIRPSRSGASESIRLRCSNRRPINDLVTAQVADYIEQHNLYREKSRWQPMTFRINQPRLILYWDKQNPRSAALAKSLKNYCSEKNPNLIVAIGGDGTMLKAIHQYWRKRIPFLGINTGHLGFLLNEINGKLGAKFFQQEFIVRPSPLLHVTTSNKERKSKEILAFTDAYIAAQSGRTGWFKIKVDNEVRIKRLIGDGVLVATAAGSSAYARAMGANPVPVGTDLLVLVGSNVLTPSNWRSGAYLPLDSEIEFNNDDFSGQRKTLGFIDGIGLNEITKMNVRASRVAAAELLFTIDHDLKKKYTQSQFP